ncbi:MAG TPA: hypothetical protein VMV47_13830 [Bacteroidales bacterium]|nr:hypothetical protein [Bacteroidales bacterium]
MKQLTVQLYLLIMILVAGCKAKDDVSFIVNFEGNNFEKKWAIGELNPDLPSDWSYANFLTFELRSSSTQWFDLKVYDSTGVRRVTIHPMQGPWVRASVPLVHFQKRNTKGMDMAAIGKTARPGYWIGFSNVVGSITSIDSLGFSMRSPIGSPYIEIRNVDLTETALDTVFGPVPLIDEFGQWIPAEWKGKAKSIEDLKASWTREDNELNSNDFKVSLYGGFLERRLKATGFFHVAKVDGVWWFVDPDGYLFYSTGSTGIGPRSEFARVTGREYLFSELPPAEKLAIPVPSSAVQTSRSGQSYSYFTWNLFRRFGEDWYPEWMDFTIRRMDNWGLNTIANWSDVNLGASGRKPYVATLRGWGIETGIMGMPDVYAPEWTAMVDEAASQQCSYRKNDPWLLGYFIGNEPPWPHREQELVNEILSGSDTPMKSELKKYLESGDTQERRKEFVYKTFDRFISTVNNAIKKHDPNHLNLGLRFGGSAPDEIITASKGFDVFSFNSYGYTASQGIIKRVTDITGQPMIIGEFHFGVPERGLAPGLAQTVSQVERAVAYRYYVENAAANPVIIGTHWFQWIDQPATGRNDGENYNIGFVDVTDRPYPELVNTTKDIFRGLYEIHSGKEPPVKREALRQ